MGTGVARPEAKLGGTGKTFLIATGVFASGLFFFYLAQARVHKRDDQTWITRHGQQPGPDGAPALIGPRIVANIDTDGPIKPTRVPLPGNDDNRGSEGILARTMSYVAGKGLHPDSHVPEHPTNKQQPTPQRVNAAGTHNYTKRLI